MAVLKLPTDPRTAVWRLLVQTLKADPTLNRTVKTWLCWEEPTKTSLLLTAATSPCIRLTPIPGPQRWYTPDSNIGELQVKVEVDILTWDVDDYLNLQGAIERALYPPDREKELAIERAFVAAGAETGQWQFSQPVMDPKAGDPEPGQPPQFNCLGMMKIDVIRTIRS